MSLPIPTDQIDAPLTVQTVERMHGIEVSGRTIETESINHFREILKNTPADSALGFLKVVSCLPDTPDDQSTETYWALVQRLQHEASAPIFKILSHWTRDADPDIRLAGIHVLAQFGCLEREASDRFPFAEETAPIVEQLLSDESETVIGAALTAAGHLGVGDLTKLAPFVDHPSKTLRWDLAFALLTRPEPLARSLLIRLSRDDEPSVRDWATLVARLADPEPEPRIEAIKGLTLRQDRRAVPAMMQELADEEIDPDLLEAAILLPDACYLPHLKRHRAAMANDVGAKQLVDEAIAACSAKPTS
jgi:HEAT repeat protein